MKTKNATHTEKIKAVRAHKAIEFASIASKQIFDSSDLSKLEYVAGSDSRNIFNLSRCIKSPKSLNFSIPGRHEYKIFLDFSKQASMDVRIQGPVTEEALYFVAKLPRSVNVGNKKLLVNCFEYHLIKKQGIILSVVSSKLIDSRHETEQFFDFNSAFKLLERPRSRMAWPVVRSLALAASAAAASTSIAGVERAVLTPGRLRVAPRRLSLQEQRSHELITSGSLQQASPAFLLTTSGSMRTIQLPAYSPEELAGGGYGDTPRPGLSLFPKVEQQVFDFATQNKISSALKLINFCLSKNNITQFGIHKIIHVIEAIIERKFLNDDERALIADLVIAMDLRKTPQADASSVRSGSSLLTESVCYTLPFFIYKSGLQTKLAYTSDSEAMREMFESIKADQIDTPGIKMITSLHISKKVHHQNLSQIIQQVRLRNFDEFFAIVNQVASEQLREYQSMRKRAASGDELDFHSSLSTDIERRSTMVFSSSEDGESYTAVATLEKERERQTAALSRSLS